MYLDYDEYRELGGTLPESSFEVLEFRARKIIDYWTDMRVSRMSRVPVSVKHCMMSLISVESKFGAEAQTESPMPTSFNTDGYSESYGSVSEQAAAASRAAASAVRQWLYGECDDEGVPLLYRGVM